MVDTKKAFLPDSAQKIGIDQQNSNIAGQQDIVAEFIPKQDVEKYIQQRLESTLKENQNKTIQNQTALFGVVNRTREFPLETYTPKDSNPLYRVDFPEEGGILSSIATFILPYRGFPYQETVSDLDKCKKIGKTFFLVLLDELREINKLKIWIILLIAPQLAKSWLKAFYAILKQQRFKPKMYCQPVRELWRVLNEYVLECKLVKDAEFAEMRRDLPCIFLEYDNAYKYRWQDIIVVIDKDNLKKNPLKELNRVLDIMISREMPADEETGPKMHLRKIKKVINVLFRLRKDYLYWLRDLILKLNFNEIKITPEDICFCEKRTDYAFGYKDTPEYQEWLRLKASVEEEQKIQENEKVS